MESEGRKIKMAKGKASQGMLWEGIDDEAFISEDVNDEDISEFNFEKETLFMANISHSRQIIKLMDGLKPPVRRLLYTMYLDKLFPDRTPQKSAVIVSNCMKIHVHGDSSLYGSMVGVVQDFKQMIPLVKGVGNFGNAARPDFYGASRYTEATMSKYSKECFFDEFDEDCVDMIQSSLLAWQPMQLPAKFPNILLNGSVGIAVGNRMGIPPFHPEDVFKMCKKLMDDPETTSAIWAFPEIPTGCDIVENGKDYKEMCKTGKGVLRMRSRIEIEETKDSFVLHVLNLPWLVSLDKVNDKIIELIKQNKVSIKNIQDASSGYRDKDGTIKTKIDYQIFISKSQDPYVIKNFLYKNTDLASSISIQFKVTTEDLKIVNLTMKELILAWLDERREYKRRLYNKKITKNKARVSLLKILIELLDKKNINKTMDIIRNNDKSDIVVSLVRDYGMNSYQADKIASMPLSTFSKDARKKFSEELKEVEKDTERLMKIVKSPKKINEIILEELAEMKKYARPRACRIINPADDQMISDRQHTIAITKQKMIKKLPENIKRGVGSLLQGDYVTKLFKANNLSKLLLVDNNGRHSILPVASVPNTETGSPGTKIFDLCKLEGEIVQASYLDEDFLDSLTDEDKKVFVVLSLSEKGIIKKTLLSEFDLKSNAKNLRLCKLKDGDFLTESFLTINSNYVLICSQKGNYAYTKISEISESSKDSQGVIGINLPEKDICGTMCVISPRTSKFIVLITEKGKVKKLAMSSLGSVKARRSTSYIGKIDARDKIVHAIACDKGDAKLIVLTSNGPVELYVEDIPETTRMSGFKKMIPLQLGCNIIDVKVSKE